MIFVNLRKRTTCYLVLLQISVALAGPVPSSRTAEFNGTAIYLSASLPDNQDMSAMLKGGIFDDSNQPVPPQLLTEAPRTNVTSIVISTPMDVPLFYPSSPSHRPGKHYGLPRETYHPLPTRGNKDSFLRPAGFAPVKPQFLGFPPIANTRENVGLEINWAAKVGRAHRSFYDFLLA